MFQTVMIIGTGSFLGGVTRFGLSRLFYPQPGTSFPIGTFVVNVVGCFLIGVLIGAIEKGALTHSGWKLFLTVGFCGGFTTFSAFAFENFLLLRNGNYLLFSLYTSLSVFLCLMALFLGSKTWGIIN